MHACVPDPGSGMSTYRQVGGCGGILAQNHLRWKSCLKTASTIARFRTHLVHTSNQPSEQTRVDIFDERQRVLIGCGGRYRCIYDLTSSSEHDATRDAQELVQAKVGRRRWGTPGWMRQRNTKKLFDERNEGVVFLHESSVV